MRQALFPLVCLVLAVCAQAQVSQPQPDQSMPRRANTVAAPVSSPALSQLQQAADNLRLDLARLRIDKWKADKSYRQQAQDNAQSLDRNLQLALPGIIQAAQAAPGSMAAQFKLYRNVNALYDVLSGLTESAGAFGPKEEFTALQNDAATFDQMRRQMADQVESLAMQKDSEITRLTSQARAETTPAAPAKKIVVDDNEPTPTPKKPKKKATPKTAPEKPKQQQ